MRPSFAALIALAIACAPAPVAAPLPACAVDCGSFDAGHNTYDAVGIDCFWNAYAAGTPVRWAVTQLTVEGDPIPGSIQFAPGQGTVVMRDMTADKFSSTSGRRVWIYRCAALARTPWATDRTKSFFELSGCTGDGSTTVFP